MREHMRFLLAIGLLTGCANTWVTNVMGPDGDPAVSITCRSDMDDCYEEAARQCPKGYKIEDKNGYTRALSDGSSKVRHNMLIGCR